MLTTTGALAVFFGAAIGIDVLLRLRDALRRRGESPTDTDRAIDAQHVEARRA